MDRRPRQNHRRCETRAPNVRFDPLGATRPVAAGKPYYVARLVALGPGSRSARASALATLARDTRLAPDLVVHRPDHFGETNPRCANATVRRRKKQGGPHCLTSGESMWRTTADYGCRKRHFAMNASTRRAHCA